MKLIQQPPLDSLIRHEETWGRFNDQPPGWRRIEQREFAACFAGKTPRAIEYRQMIQTLEGKELTRRIHAQLFFYGTDGLAIECRHWKGELVFYRFGCKHQYKVLERYITPNHGGTYEYLECTKCGNVVEGDSSD